MRSALAGLALVLAVSACTGSEAKKPPYRFTAERLVVLQDGSIALAGIAASGMDEDGGCRPGESAWNFFVARVSPRGRLVRTDVIEETDLDACGDLLIEARAGPAGRIDATGWAVQPGQDETHGPVGLSFEADGSTRHSFEDGQRLRDYGPIAFAETKLPEGGNARMWARGDRAPLQLEIERPGLPDVRTPVGGLPANARLFENWLYWYSLTADHEGVFGSGPYTPGEEGDYTFPVFRHLLDGSLDRRFGGDGVVLAHPPGVDFPVMTQAVADRTGGVYVVGGGDVDGRRITYVMSFRTSGELEESFGEGGVVRLPLGRTTDSNYADTRAALGVLRDERIAVVGGIQAKGSTLWVLHPDGTLDRSFGRNGRLVLTAT